VRDSDPDPASRNQSTFRPWRRHRRGVVVSLSCRTAQDVGGEAERGDPKGIVMMRTHMITPANAYAEQARSQTGRARQG